MPVNLHGTDYSTVAERLEVAHGGADGRPKGIQSIATEFLPVGTALLCRATVTFLDGRAFHGTSEVPIDSKQPAERDAPFECGETSAVGRALANAGYSGSDKGLAGAEEAQRPPRRNSPAPTSAATKDTRPLRDARELMGTPTPPTPPTPAPEPPAPEWPDAATVPTPRERWMAAHQALSQKGHPPTWKLSKAAGSTPMPEEPPADVSEAKVLGLAVQLESRLAGLTARPAGA